MVNFALIALLGMTQAIANKHAAQIQDAVDGALVQTQLASAFLDKKVAESAKSAVTELAQTMLSANSTSEGGEQKEEKQDNTMMYIIIGVVVLLIIVLAIVIFCCCCKKGEGEAAAADKMMMMDSEKMGMMENQENMMGDGMMADGMADPMMGGDDAPKMEM